MLPRERRILCAEPHEDTCSLISTLLVRQGHQVVSAKTIGECLALAGRELFDLYILDDDYIDGTSLELCKQLRRLTPETPILFFSSHAFQRDRDCGLEAGASAYLTKPGDIFEIVQTINAILRPSALGPAPNEAE
ncbi:MAG: response regulator [Acidobacteria bacterium]|nr:response regulator [Acidobacteriota bacterium]